MKITIPAGSLVVMPKGNAKHIPMTNPLPIEVDTDDVDVYLTWKHYVDNITIGSMKFIDRLGAIKIALAMITTDKQYLKRYGLHEFDKEINQI